ncbi:MAG: hypothetical protein CVU00_13930 [Bacteroidetes bacterium HGW-Bacteroidetes-17]|jgi:peptidoglycan hydrolase CwlO-like protein|nr:MAG: hypothetical protein CVU00_13930 [Bacteroidetes bacterium HGW-Bacteroidetes-17]
MKTENKSVMIGISIVLLMAVVILSGIIISNKTDEIQQLNMQNIGLNMTIEERDSLVNEIARTFDEIEQNLTFVRDKRGQLVLSQGEGIKNQKEMLVSDIKLMNEMLKESSKKIEDLDKKLKSSGVEIKSFRNKIAQLNKSIEEQNSGINSLQAQLVERDFKIAEMDMQMMQLQSDIASKADAIDEKSQIIVAKDDELNKAFFASGTLKELKEHGVVIREGGFLGLGKSNSVPNNLNDSYFTELDQRSTRTVPIFTKKAKFISEHPDSSYSFIFEDDMIAYLQIEDPEEFWKISKYAILAVK